MRNVTSTNLTRLSSSRSLLSVSRNLQRTTVFRVAAVRGNNFRRLQSESKQVRQHCEHAQQVSRVLFARLEYANHFTNSVDHHASIQDKYR